MSEVASKPVERLFPFAVRARKIMIGRETLARSKSKLQWLLLAEDISETSRDQVLHDFKDYPVVQKFTAADFERFFGARNTKVIGFVKSTLAKSIYAELKESRINKPEPKISPEADQESPSPSGSTT